ncbi:MAG: hypothetical protein ACYCQI_17225 [Gammaproteobacteria bacterium]
MKRINVTFYDEIYEGLEERTKEKKCDSIAQSIRELVDLGMRVERAATQNTQNENESNDINFIVETMKNIMRWALESLLISRQLMMNLQGENHDEAESILKKCKEQATNHAKKMFPETGEIIN